MKWMLTDLRIKLSINEFGLLITFEDDYFYVHGMYVDTSDCIVWMIYDR